MTRPLILLSNDDGYARRGIRAMREALATVADVVICAPEHEQSASSHALSLSRSLRLREVEKGAIYALDGTPADCVYVALHSKGRVLPRRPDLVVSGVNHGLNLGQDVFYSGTVAAAREGAFRGIPAVAASAHPKLDYGIAARAIAKLAIDLFGRVPFETTPLLNVNFPADWKGELRATRLGERLYEESVEFRTDPRGREYLWLGGGGVRHERDEGSDTDAYDEGVASITPLMLDLTGRQHTVLVLDLAKQVGGET
jgi:5'-nucleotidase